MATIKVEVPETTNGVSEESTTANAISNNNNHHQVAYPTELDPNFIAPSTSMQEPSYLPPIPIFKREEEKIVPLFNQQQPETPVAQPDTNDEYSIIGIPMSEQRRIVSEKGAKYEAKIAVDPWDTEAWTLLMMEAQSKDIRIGRAYYERFLSQFPTAGRYWKQYAEQELYNKSYDNVDKIFARSLLNCLNIDLWKAYVAYIRSTREFSVNKRAEITKAFEFALHHIGMDISSTSIWQDYISFLKSFQPNNQYEEGQKITALRKLYHRAIENPMHNLEAIWRDYDTFENELNKILAKELITKTAPRYMTARSIFRERKRYYEGILRNMLARPPSPSEKEGQQVSLWKRLIIYEKGNPQRLEPEPLYKRVVFTYNQCLLCLYHYPEIWFDFANYELQSGHPDAASAVFDRATDAIPHCLLLYFSHADILEQQKNIKAAKDVYEKLLTRNQSTLVYVQYMKFSRRTEGIKGARIIFKRGRSSPLLTHHLFVASALMEWQINKDMQVARNVFELGMNKFPAEPEYILEYLKFLSFLNEENNLRVLFEKAVASVPREKAREIWNMYLQFEYNYGDLSTISKIESRRSKIYPETDISPILALVNRFRYLDLWPCDNAELDSFERQPEPKFEVSGKDDKDTEDILASGKSNPKLARFPRPDLSQMVPYKNEAPTNSNVLPDIINQMISALPPALEWVGPIPDVEQIMLFLAQATMPPAPADATEVAPPPMVHQKKRKTIEEEEEEEETTIQPQNVPPPQQDVFRKRQAAKLKQKNVM